MLVIQILRRTTKEANLCHIKTYPLASLSNSQAISFVSCQVVETQGIQLETFKAGNYLFANLNRMACFDTFQVVEPQVCCNKLLQVQQSLMVTTISSVLVRLTKGLIMEFGMEHQR